MSSPTRAGSFRDDIPELGCKGGQRPLHPSAQPVRLGPKQRGRGITLGHTAGRALRACSFPPFDTCRCSQQQGSPRPGDLLWQPRHSCALGPDWLCLSWPPLPEGPGLGQNSGKTISYSPPRASRLTHHSGDTPHLSHLPYRERGDPGWTPTRLC